MRCPICSAIVTGGDVCENCGATLPANVRPPKPAARRGGLLGTAVKAKRPSTLGDMFRSAAGARPVEQPPRRGNQRPAPAGAQPPRDAQRPARRPTFGRRAPQPPSPPPARTPPPAPVSPPPAYPSELDPWASTYGPVPYPLAAPSAPPSPPPSGFDEAPDAWEADPGWGVSAPPAVAPSPYDSYDAYGASPNGWQQPPAPPGAPWNGAPYAMAGAPARMPGRTRPTVSGVSRLTLNVTMFGIVLLILGVAILVGLRYVQSMQDQGTQAVTPTPTIAPTVVPPNGFAGLQADLYSVSYPTRWTHETVGDVLGCGCALSGETFGDGADTSLAIYTRPAAPADELAQVLTQAIVSVSPSQTPQAVQLNQQRTYGGAHWIENDYAIVKVAGSRSIQLQVRVLVVNVNATTYIVVAAAPQSSFSHANATYFEPMLRSVRFD